MGGCSTKPKTAEFEGALDLQEENLQEPASRNNSEAEHAGWEGIERQQEVCELPIQVRATELTKGHDETQDVPALPGKELIEGFREETLVLRDDCQLVKHVLEETITGSGVEKELPSNQELAKLHITPEIIGSESSEGHDDPVLIIDLTKELEEDIRHFAAHDTETAVIQHKLLILSNGNLEKEDVLTLFDGSLENGEKGIENGIFSDHSSPSLQDGTKVDLKPMCPGDKHLELSKDHLFVEVADALEPQKEPMDLGDCHSGLQEEASNIEIESERQNSVNENGEQSRDEQVTLQEQGKHFEEGIKECEESCKDSKAVAHEVLRAAVDDGLDLKSAKEVLKDLTKPIEEDILTGEACEDAGEDFIIGACKDSPVAKTSDQESLKEIVNMGDGHLAKITDASTLNSRHVVTRKTKEQEADVDTAARKSAESFVKIFAEPDRAPMEDKMAVKDVIPQADSHLMKDVPAKEASVESLDTVDGEGEVVCGKNCFNDKHLLQQVVVGEESSHLNPEISSEDENKPCAVVLDLKGQQKSHGAPFPNGVTAFQVIATAEKPKAQSDCAMELTGMAFIPDQDVQALDIDEVLEKLASEFERQERVACATP